MTISFQKLLTDCLVALGDPTCNTWSRTDAITPWAKEAMLAFPILRPRLYSYTLTDDYHYVVLPDDFREIISVEYPIEQEPPVYLSRKNRFDDNFYAEEGFYDLDRDYASDGGWLVWCSKLLTASSVIYINYLANHDTTVVDMGDSYITVPDQYENILIAYVVVRAYRERLSAFMQDPTAHMTIITQMTNMVLRAEQNYKDLVDQSVKRLIDSRITPHQAQDKYDRVY
jgi:hypothetical protein